jgi:hypothetical protein
MRSRTRSTSGPAERATAPTFDQPGPKTSIPITVDATNAASPSCTQSVSKPHGLVLTSSTPETSVAALTGRNRRRPSHSESLT